MRVFFFACTNIRHNTRGKNKIYTEFLCALLARSMTNKPMIFFSIQMQFIFNILILLRLASRAATTTAAPAHAALRFKVKIRDFCRRFLFSECSFLHLFVSCHLTRFLSSFGGCLISILCQVQQRRRTTQFAK